LGVALGIVYNILGMLRVVPARIGTVLTAHLGGLVVPNAILAAIICALIFHGVSLAGYIYYTSKIGLPNPVSRISQFLIGIVDDYAYLLLKFSGVALIVPAAKSFVAARDGAEEPALFATKEEIAAELENDEEQTGMGQGDAKLAAMIGAFLFLPQSLVAFLVAFLVGGLTGIGMMLFKKKAGRTAIPFGPYLVSGAIVSLLFGDRIITWYLAYALGKS
jgi:prepilin signal peptidase PulO-like enzyme (type II secretory pathway)